MQRKALQTRTLTLSAGLFAAEVFEDDGFTAEEDLFGIIYLGAPLKAVLGELPGIGAAQSSAWAF